MRRPTLLSLLLLAAFLLPTSLLAQVRDQAGFFSPAAVQQADKNINQFRQQTGKDLLLETIPAVPADQQAQFQSLGTDRFFQQYAATRARQAGLNGVYVLVSREPSHLQVSVGNETLRSGAFTAADRDQLRDTLLTNFRAHDYDKGLLDSVAQVQQTLTANVPAANSRGATPPRIAPNTTPFPPERRTGHSGLFWLVVLIGGGLLLLTLLRRLASRAAGYPSAGYQQTPPPLPGQPQQPYGAYPGYGAGGGAGGGFGRGILGGLLGGAAGGWLYDRMSHRPDAGSYPGQSMPPSTGNPDAFPPSAPDTDFSSSSGGDFGDTGGSSDSGGGDFGGGGGDPSSGGGDF